MIRSLLIITLVSAVLIAGEYHAVLVRPAEKAVQLDLSQIYGDVSVSGRDTNVVVIRQFFSASGSPADDRLDRQFVLRDTVISFKPDELLSRGFGLRYQIIIPSRFGLIADQLGGDIMLSNVNGAVKVNSAGGGIIAENLRGLLKISSGGGSIDLANVEGKIICNTGGGQVQMSNIDGDLKLNSGGGNIFLTTAEGIVGITTLSGNIEVSEFAGKTIQCVTSGGNIVVKNLAAHDASLSTTSGNISMDLVSGTVDCELWAGNLSAENVTGDFNIKIRNGDLRIDDLQGSLSAEELNGNIFLQKFYPDSEYNKTSSIFCQNGDINIEYFGEDVQVEASSMDGRIISNFLIEISEHPAQSVYLPKLKNHEINLKTTRGNIIANKGEKR